MILNVYFGEQLLEKTAEFSLFIKSISSSAFFYFLLVFLIFFFICLYLFVIKPLFFKQSPEKAYKKYLYLREEMEKIDALYLQRDINFEDYVFAQFNYAKEYEQVIVLLSKYPEYKSKIKSYKIAHVKKQEEEEQKLSKEEVFFRRNVNLLYNVLKPYTKYYSEEEIRQGVLDEGYDNKIADAIVSLFKKENIVFGSEVIKKENKFVNLINKLFGSKKQDVPEKQDKEPELVVIKEQPTPEPVVKKQSQTRFSLDSTEDKIDINSLTKNQKQNFFEENNIDINSFKFVDQKENKSFFSKIFKKKKKPSVDEINNIFNDIKKHIDN